MADDLSVGLLEIQITKNELTHLTHLCTKYANLAKPRKNLNLWDTIVARCVGACLECDKYLLTIVISWGFSLDSFINHTPSFVFLLFFPGRRLHLDAMRLLCKVRWTEPSSYSRYWRPKDNEPSILFVKHWHK